ncbi:septal ring factor EnvC (AmiA/AmiB activator) [Parabacteroides sp. PFB2-10]|uniref:type VII secretion EssA family protein n=1 Tax=Parabacteroides sp. PFB2-10 TaxID=1742405 RepID=UPI002476B895|nr:type VII secretion EssA family protein [Parabacteroides sp. PFB2-10]MDH6311605.1 septal ring factor EnvC (AmiA/AmiB activator) [Parabacteroides sp. PFB2-10]
MRILLLVIAIFGMTNLSAQSQIDSLLTEEISIIKNTIDSQKQEISVLQQKLNTQQIIVNQQKNALDILISKTGDQQKQIDSLKLETKNSALTIQSIANELGAKIQETEVTAKDGISKLDRDVTLNRLYWVIGTLFILLLCGMLYLLLGKRIQTSKTDVETQIRNTKKSLEEESVKLDSKLVEVLETQLKLQQGEKQIAFTNLSNEIDHSLALKVADEIVRMQKNISKMDDDTKGLKPLIKGIERIQANFASNGYEMVNLLNKDYDERMSIDVINFITDDNLPDGRKVITAVIKPQVNYNGVLIQRAQVDVSQN